ncbi:MAG: universal stress protein [Halobacteriales archaeon]
MHDDILIPTDGSKQASNAVKRGLLLARDLDATVHALYVVEDFESRIAPITGEQQRVSEEQVEHGESVVEDVAQAAESLDVDVVAAVEKGRVHKEIKEYIEDNDVDFIVMGSRGRTNIEKAILGSTADRIIRTLAVPTMVVHEPPDSFGDLDEEIHLAGE